MEFSYTTSPAPRLLHLKCAGPVTADDLVAAIKRIGADTIYQPGMPVLADFREASGSDWDYSEIQRFRDYIVRISQGWKDVRWAAVVRPGSIQAVGHIVILITEALEAGITIRQFSSPEEALVWLSR
jgi:hypothetical protein